ncbi:hypothetical protein [Desertifilum sp. FACHB-868]|uniref:Uncharacterized protein n=1 Tax=Desertifilum tharense IPPAS B-1220 TaxID=1781255 RepID=A0ACD5GN67_9CYAN|nr:hypothetical protein [Desertifilum sp. FACHB-868]
MVCTATRTQSWKSLQFPCWMPEKQRQNPRRIRRSLIAQSGEEGIDCEYLQQMLASLESLSE